MSESDDTGNKKLLQFSVMNDLREIAVAADRIDEFCSMHGLPPSTAYAVNLSVDELLTNTISYGYEDSGEHRIDLTIRLDAGVLAIEISDDGIEFAPDSAKDPDTEASIEDRPIGGLGIFLTRQMMDSFDYRRDEGRNIVTLTKKTGS